MQEAYDRYDSAGTRSLLARLFVGPRFAIATAKRQRAQCSSPSWSSEPRTLFSPARPR